MHSFANEIASICKESALLSAAQKVGKGLSPTAVGALGGAALGAGGGAVFGNKNKSLATRMLGGAAIGAAGGAAGGAAVGRYRRLAKAGPVSARKFIGMKPAAPVPNKTPPGWVEAAGKRYSAEELAAAREAAGGQQFATQKEFRNWHKQQASKYHPDLLGPNATPEQIAAAQERMSRLSLLNSLVSGGAGEHLGIGKLSHAIYLSAMRR